MSLRDLVHPPDTLEATYASSDGKSQRIRVVVTDIDMPIGKLVPFVLKLAIAAIPVWVIMKMLAAVAAGVLTLAAG